MREIVFVIALWPWDVCSNSTQKLNYSILHIITKFYCFRKLNRGKNDRGEGKCIQRNVLVYGLYKALLKVLRYIFEKSSLLVC